ncbi:MAG: redoxin family protein [Actinobacteria bacterium]|nr:redoxin family protein [Actinomycetota bacterium]
MNPRRAAVLASVVAVFAVLAAFVALSQSAPASSQLRPSASVLPASSAKQAPELVGVSDFDNTDPLTLAGKRGSVVLVDFWTYTCINCRRTFPFLRALQKTYGGKDFTVLGVHSPEFAFERDHGNVARAVRELGVTWPVAEDPDMATWDAFRNQYWPADYLVDRSGRIRYVHYGEGGDADIEKAVRALLDEGGTAPAASVGQVEASERPGNGLTPETYFGGERSGNYLAGGEIVPPGRTVTRDDPDPGPDQVRVHGRVTGKTESLLLGKDAWVEQQLTARDVYLTASSQVGPVTLDVTLDGQPVPADRRGRSLQVVGGRTVVVVEKDDLYALLTAGAVEKGTLRLTAQADGAELFTTTYGG